MNSTIEFPSPKISWRSLVAAILVVTAGLGTLAAHRYMPLQKEVRDKELPFMYHWDSQCYYHIAIGWYSQVASPFSKRPLYPWLAAGLARCTGAKVETAFLICNSMAFALLAYCICAVIEMGTGQPWLGVPLLLTPFPLGSLELAYLPDLFHTALTALFFLLLLKKKTLWALLVLMVCFATRESTLLLCLVCAGFAYKWHERALLKGSLIVLILGIVFSSAVAKLGKPNLHHMPEILYLGLKVPYNFLLNFLGIGIWSDVVKGGEPLVKWPVPAFLHSLITDRELGLVLNWRLPLQTLTLFLTIFGIGPALLWPFVRNRTPVKELPMAVQMAFVYGIVCYLLGPTLGNWTERLIGYGWPAFWIALPWLTRRLWADMPVSRRVFWALYFLAVAWWPSFWGWANTRNSLLCALALLLYLPLRPLIRQLNFQLASGQPLS